MHDTGQQVVIESLHLRGVRLTPDAARALATDVGLRLGEAGIAHGATVQRIAVKLTGGDGRAVGTIASDIAAGITQQLTAGASGTSSTAGEASDA